MRQQTGLVSREGVYYLRVRVPRDLVTHYEIKRSLSTRDPKDARALGATERKRVHRELESARIPVRAERRDKLSEQKVKHLVSTWLADQLARDERDPALRTVDLDAVSKSIAVGEDALRESLPAENIGRFAFETDRLLRGQGLHVTARSRSRRTIAYGLMKAAARLNSILRARQDGLAVDTTTQPGPLACRESLSDLLEDWQAQAPRRPNTVRDFKIAVQQLGFNVRKMSQAEFQSFVEAYRLGAGGQGELREAELST